MSNPNYVFVLDTNRKPLTPCKPSLARKLLGAGKAKVFRLYPFTIILNKEVIDTPKPYRESGRHFGEKTWDLRG